MSRRQRDQQRMIRLYQDETGIFDFHLPDVAAWAEKRGFQMPKAPTPVELLTRQLGRSARAETRPDPTGEIPYRANHAYTKNVDGEDKVFWFDVDGPAATQGKVRKALALRRGQALNDVVHIAVDLKHWNETHPSEQVEIDFDFNDEVLWRLNAPRDEDNQDRIAS